MASFSFVCMYLFMCADLYPAENQPVGALESTEGILTGSSI